MDRLQQLHITGFHKDYKKIYENNALLENLYGKVADNKLFQAFYKNFQKLQYKVFCIPDTAKSFPSKLKEYLTTKTFYIGGTDKYFNSNFVPDLDDFALKTKNPVKVSKTKIGAIITAIKRDGLSGIKGNELKALGGVVLAVGLAFVSIKLIKNGLQKISPFVVDNQNSKNNEDVLMDET